MTKKLLVIFGATGQQGSSVITQVLNDPLLSKQYTLRAVTRDPSKPSAQSLQAKGLQVVSADFENPPSIHQALEGAHTVFALTTTIYGPPGPSYETELAQGKLLADATVQAGAKYLIWSSSTNVTKISSGKLDKVFHFNVKADIEDYIRTLPIQSAFFTPASFMQNFQGHFFKVRPVGDGTYALSNIVKPETQIPWIEIAEDTGKFVGTILTSPEEYAGKIFAAATRTYSMEEIVGIISKATGKEVKYVQLPVEVFRGFVPEGFRDQIVEMLLFFEEYGYYGPGTVEKVQWTVEQVKGELTTFEKYLERNPIQLE